MIISFLVNPFCPIFFIVSSRCWKNLAHSGGRLRAVSPPCASKPKCDTCTALVGPEMTMGRGAVSVSSPFFFLGTLSLPLRFFLSSARGQI